MTLKNNYKHMNISAKYDPASVEDKWYKYWMENGFFNSDPDEREPYTIVIPPPNVTGVLHMGHMLNNTIQDILIRRARMQGKNALWVPGTDHASIATEARVVAKLKSEGIDKTQLTRDEFLEHAWEWKEKHGGIILEQLQKLGASCDWRRTRFTMDKDYSKSVIKVFVDLYNKGQIYRGIRMVNWDPQAKTAVSDEEVIYKEVESKLYHIQYKIKGEDGYVTIATTRPETILGDTAVCVNPADKRYSSLVGKTVLVPLINRSIPVIADEYVDMEFGTGCLKITPAHDVNDYEIGIRHNLEVIDILNDDGTLNEKAEIFIGEDREKVRKEIVPQLKDSGNLVKTEDYVNKIGFSERTDAVIEPKLSMQWFLKMKDVSEPALENVLNDNIKLVPKKFKNTYRHWMENVKDWCISRQLWWGHRIPVYYINGTNDFVVAESLEEAIKLAREKTGDQNIVKKNLMQDEDVLDTWFSSWLWPISVFDGLIKPGNNDIEYYYPTNDLITAPEILFFWVARMIIAGYEYKSAKPFSNVYLTGIVRDNQRRKMSKSLGNSPDPLELMKKYSADGVRVGMLLCSPAGNDLLFEENLPEQGRNFGNKIWNAFRLVMNWEVKADTDQQQACKDAINWFDHKLNFAIKQMDDHFSKYRLSDALMIMYKLFWDEFSSWYLEMVKPAYQKSIDKTTYNKTIDFFEKLLLMLHPFMPFITEEIWQSIREREKGESIMIAQMPKIHKVDKKLIGEFEDIKEIVSNIRTIRKKKNIVQKEALIFKYNASADLKHISIVKKLCNVDGVENIGHKVENAASFLVKAVECYIPLGDLVDKEEELKKLQADLEYNQGFLKTVMKKLGNEKFVNNAPEKVVEIEKKKKNDAEEKIRILEEQIKNWK